MILIIFCKAIGHLWLPRRVYVLSGLKVMWAFFGVIQHFDPTQRVLTLPEVFARKFASIVVLFEVVGVLAPEPRAVFESLWFICCLPCAAIFFLLKCQRAPQSIANHWWLPAFLRPDVRWKRMARRQPCSSARTEKGQTWQINSQQYASNKEQSLLRCELSSQYISNVLVHGAVEVSWIRGFQDVCMGWRQAGITVFTFAAPSAVMAVPFAIGNAGFLGGMLLCLIITGGWDQQPGCNAVCVFMKNQCSLSRKDSDRKTF